ncbi:MAG: Ig-like domain-containing protein, partial [Sulfurovum sp.]
MNFFKKIIFIGFLTGNFILASTRIFINEIHYDNINADNGEGVEIFAPSGTDLNGWSIVAINGNNHSDYTTKALVGTIPNLANGYGVLYFPISGLQNGAPDGIALVNSANTVVQFLSYEGSVLATSGVANGMTSIDIGVTESSNTPIGHSLQLSGTGTKYEDFTWSSANTNTFGSINMGQSITNQSPTSSNTSFTIDEDTNKTFEDSDFSFIDMDRGSSLNAIIITTLPIAGVLTLSDVIVTLNQEITTANIANLKFIPKANENGIPYTTFEFKVNDGEANSTLVYTATINVNAVYDAPTEPITPTPTSTSTPTENNIPTITMNEDQEQTLIFIINDIDNDMVTPSIKQEPNHGTLIMGISNIVYTPNTGFSGSDSFVLLFDDGNGGKIEKTILIIVTAKTTEPTEEGENSVTVASITNIISLIKGAVIVKNENTEETIFSIDSN